MSANILQNKVLPLIIAIFLLIGVLSIGFFTSINNGGDEKEDDTKPTIIDTTDNRPYTGDPLEVTAEISDDNKVKDVWIEYKLTSADGSITSYNRSMKNSDHYRYEIEIDDEAVYLRYTISAMDKSDNWNSTSEGLKVIDNELPEVVDITSSTPLAGESFKITADITDNIKVEAAWLEYSVISKDESKNYNKSMDHDGDYWYNINLRKNATILDYTILAKDTSNNWNSESNSLEVEKPDYMFGWSVGDQEDGYGTILHTDDGGTDWNRQGNPSTIPDASLSQVRALNRSTAWIVGGKADGYGTVLKTTDGGKTWNRIADDLIPNSDIEGVSIIDKDTVWIAGQNNTLLVTHDGGESWESKSNSSYDSFDLSDVVALNENNIWICGGEKDNKGLILHSINGGESWTRESENLVSNHSLISLSVVNENHAWAIGGQATTIKTTNGGDTWEKVGEGVFPGISDGNGVCALDNDTAWIVMDYGVIYRTDNNGEKWTQQESNASEYYLLRITAINESNAWITGSAQFPPINGILLHTTDNGKTWERIDYGLNSGLWDVYFVGAYH